MPVWMIQRLRMSVASLSMNSCIVSILTIVAGVLVVIILWACSFLPRLE